MKPHTGIEGGQRRPETPLLKGPSLSRRVGDGVRGVADSIRSNSDLVLYAAFMAAGIAVTVAQVKKALADTVYCGTDQPRLVKETPGTEVGDIVVKPTGLSDIMSGPPSGVWERLLFKGALDYDDELCIIGGGINVLDNASLEKLARLDLTNISHITEEGVILDGHKAYQLVETSKDPPNKYIVEERGQLEIKDGLFISHGGYIFHETLIGKYPSPNTHVLRAVSVAKVQQSQPGEENQWDKQVDMIQQEMGGGMGFTLDTSKNPPALLCMTGLANGKIGYIEIQLPKDLSNLDFMQDNPSSEPLPGTFHELPYSVERIVVDPINGDKYFDTSMAIMHLMIESKGTIYQIPAEVCSEYIKTITPLPGSGGVYIVEEGSKLPRIIIPEGNPPPGGIGGLLVLDVVATDKLKENGIPYKIWTYLKAGPGEIGDFPIDVDKETIEGCVAAPSKEYDPSLTSPCQGKTCDDNKDCTKDTCNEITGKCMYPAVTDGTPCDDNDPNTINDSCKSGECKGATPPPPDDPPDNQIPDKTPLPEIEMEEESDEILDASEEATEAEETEKKQDIPDVIVNVEPADAEDAVDPTDVITPEEQDEAKIPEQESAEGTEPQPDYIYPPDKPKTDNLPELPDVTIDNTTEKPDIPIPPPDQSQDTTPPDQVSTEEVTPPEPPKSGGGCNSPAQGANSPETLFGIAALGTLLSSTSRRVRGLLQRTQK